MHIQIGLDMYVYGHMETYVIVTVCFCYRSRESQRVEDGGQAMEHVPWETCALS